jgi:histone-lysine N-methyltransferase SETMAR
MVLDLPSSAMAVSHEVCQCGHNELIDNSLFIALEWRNTSSPKPKVRVQRSAGKVMLTFFWDYKGPILEHYMPGGNTVTSATYSHLLRENLKPSIRQKQRRLLMTGVCLDDNVKPHTATATVSTIEVLRFECIPHPPYSSDLALSDFHVFSPLKDALSGTQFRDDDEIRSAVHEWLCIRLKEFFSRGIYVLFIRWCKCTELEGDYVEQ